MKLYVLSEGGRIQNRKIFKFEVGGPIKPVDIIP